MNICGVLVHAQPHKVDAVVEALGALEGVEVHQTADGGRIIVTVEDSESSTAGDTLLAINRVAGIVSTALVYHHTDDYGTEPAGTAVPRN